MKFAIKGFVILFVSLLAVLAISFFAPLQIPYYQDFSVIYFTDKALLHGIPIYDYPAQLAFVKTLTPAEFSFHPFPYPPWYALTTLFIGLLPIQVAARAWFLLNLGMLTLTAWLLTPAWKFPLRILGILAAILFIPAFGLLVVGQYSAPVLLGAALFVYAARKNSAFLLAAALLLLTFKPHIGIFLLAAGLIWLILERNSFLKSASGSSLSAEPHPWARRALTMTVTGAVLLAGLGFLADAAWPFTYIQSLARYRDIPGVQSCDLCASLSVAVVRLVTGHASIAAAAGLSLLLAVLLGFFLFRRFRIFLKDPAALMALSASLTLLIDPYLLNYDYILLLLPLFWLAGRSRLAMAVYFFPWAVIVLGRNSNSVLALAGLVIFILILQNTDTIDSLPLQAYNHVDN